jgi:transposase
MYTSQPPPEHRVVTPGGAAHLHVHLLGPLPLIRHFLHRMTFDRIVGSCLGPTRTLLLDHARTLTVLIENILLSPGPLYRMADWIAPYDPGALGLSRPEKDAVNDDRIARTLDALGSQRSRGLFFRLALHLIKDFQLDTSRIHQDTTSVTFYGAYEHQSAPPFITRGLNKDGRPDLKQLVFGVSVTADGAVPLVHEVHSGNRTDDTIHRGNLARLREVLKTSRFVYVADSKLCTEKNLAEIALHRGWFVTVLPRTWKEDKLQRRQLRSHPVRWRTLCVVPNKRRKSDPPDVYSTTAAEPRETSQGYRLVWIRSSQKAALDAAERKDRIERAEEDFADLSSRLNLRKLRRPGAIRKAARDILKKHDCKNLLSATLRYETRIRFRRTRRGRPRADDPKVEEHHRVYRIDLARNETACAEEERTDGVFALVTNIPAGKNGAKREILEVYKYQAFVEKRHALLKSELEVARMYLKKPHRVVGMVHAHFLAMVVEALIERTIRRGMASAGIKSLPILPEGRPTTTPTAPRVLEAFSSVCWYEFERGDETVAFPVRLTTLQKQLLRLLGMETAIYE